MNKIINKKNNVYNIPRTFSLVRDIEKDGYRQSGILERHFHDVYVLFLHQFLQIESKSEITDEEKTLLRSLLDEILYIKSLL